MSESVGERIALIRVAIGGSVRDQISQDQLGELVGWDKYKVSRVERGAQPLSREDAIALANVDPLRRGPAWVMFGDPPQQGGRGAVDIKPKPTPKPTETRGSVQLTPKDFVASVDPKKKAAKKRQRPPREARAG